MKEGKLTFDGDSKGGVDEGGGFEVGFGGVLIGDVDHSLFPFQDGLE